MRARVNTLAQLMKLKRANGSKFVLMLGAGASLSSGIKTTAGIMQELLDKYGQDLPAEGDVSDRFDPFWARSTEEQRRLFLTPYLDRQPSAGYLKLAEAVREGYFDLAITFNYDDLLRRALEQIGFRDFKEIIRGETDDTKIARLVEAPQWKFTILKLHGSLYSADTFLFDRGEMLSYPPDLEALVVRLTKRDIIVCGYGFADMCVMRAFSPQGGSVFWVNPSGAPSAAKGILVNRRSKDRVISGDELGRFDGFATALAEELFAAEKPVADGPRTNPFKFLESFDVGDQEWFFGREALTETILGHLAGHPGALHLIGPPKAGKTSLARAGVLASLAPEQYQRIYLRCRPDLEAQLRELLTTLLARDDAAALEPGRGFEELALGSGKHVVVVLDQFERVLKELAGSDTGAARLTELVRRLGAGAPERVSIVSIAVADNDYFKLMWKAGLNPRHVDVPPMTPEEAMAVVARQCEKAGLDFEPDVLAALRAKFDEHPGEEGSHFTLAHLQAICYLLVDRSIAGPRSYASLIGSELEASLDSAIRECDIMNFVEDLPGRHDRMLLRGIMKIVPEPSRRSIAAYVRDRYAELMSEPQYPEPF